MVKKRVLIIYFSYSSQTRNLLQSFAGGLEESNVEVVWQQLKTIKKMQFPLRSVFATFEMMVQTFFRKKIEVEPIDEECYSGWDLIILAGPTWSYNPSGPVLSLIENQGDVFFARKVLPFISCRSYWRMNYYCLKRKLNKLQAQVVNPLIFKHAGSEPWLTIGVFLKLSGKVPESNKSRFSKLYSKYGHSREQLEKAYEIGKQYGVQFEQGKKIEEMNIPAVKHV